ncbi:DUF2341 domain-containing protein [Thermococcus sp. 21S9]|uniref:DUF2341 domain-containing protein n=1 Tax=Thermococcus sp. 21S9 TaxID=1638223 RepID=UPI00143AFB53|nr:DUF2341 domain-containing protein [Thermococcus sp. 21S9]NJE54618.1 DUF2341 domain-containing protein [Thermococcus sp. 21S9]
MKRRGFIINSTVLVLLIPLLLLLATYSNVTSYVLQAQSQATRLKTTQDVVSYLQLDLQNVMRLSIKRALVLSIAFVTSVQPLDNAQLALEDLVKYGAYPQITSAGADWASRERQFMGNATLLDWLNNMRDYLATMGYRMVTPPSQVLDSINLTIAPLDSFHIVANVTIPHIVIEDSSGKIVYNSSIPPTGSLYVVVPITNLEDPLVSYLTRGRLSRVINPCQFAYPNITPPYYLLTGYGDPETMPLKFAAPFAPTIASDKIYYGDTYPGDGALAYVLKDQPTTTPSSAFVFDTRVNGSLVSPSDVLKDGNMGVMVFSGTVGAGTTWCDDNYAMKTDFTLSGVSDGQVVLLKFNPATVPFSQIRHNGSYADLRIYTSSCVPARYWIEKWDSNEVLIWLNVTGTSYSIYYSSDTGAPLSRGYLNNVFGNNYVENVTLSPGQSLFLFNTTSPVFIRYNASASANADFGGGVSLNVSARIPANVLNVSLDYPSSVSDVQVPVYLNSTWASLIPHSGNEARIEVYSDPSLTTALPFWIEYWNNNGALIWVRTSVPGNVYIRFGDDLPLTQGNGSQVFEFFDDFSYLTAGLPGSTIASLLESHGWNVGGDTDYLTSGNGVLDVSGDSSWYYPEVWLWTQKRFPYYTYVVGMGVKLNGEPFLGWYITSTDIGLIEHIYYSSFYNGYYGHLYTFDFDQGDELSYYGTGGEYLYNAWTHLEIAIDWTSTGGVYFETYQNQTGPFTGTWGGDTVSVSYYSTFYPYSNTAIGLGQFYGGPTEYDFVYVRKYLDLSALDENVSRVYTEKSTSFQLVDNWTTSGRLFILQDWNTTLASYPAGTWPIDVPNRYEVDVVPYTNLFLNYTHEPNSAVSQNSNSIVNVSVAGNISVYLTVNNSAGNSAHFSWVFWAPYPYSVLSPVLGAPQQRPPAGNYVSARVFDIQPFISCILDDRYFGVAGAPSFFERLEGGSSVHRAHYVALAQAMQKAVYGSVKYPIGLVSFILPKNLPANLNFLVREQPAVDYIYLDYADYPGDDPSAMQVLGISATGGISTTPVLDQNFYLTPTTASLIFGPYANDLLVPIGSG